MNFGVYKEDPANNHRATQLHYEASFLMHEWWWNSAQILGSHCVDFLLRLDWYREPPPPIKASCWGYKWIGWHQVISVTTGAAKVAIGRTSFCSKRVYKWCHCAGIHQVLRERSYGCCSHYLWYTSSTSACYQWVDLFHATQLESEMVFMWIAAEQLAASSRFRPSRFFALGNLEVGVHYMMVLLNYQISTETESCFPFQM